VVGYATYAFFSIWGLLGLIVTGMYAARTARWWF
jgi:hypothetical protein